MGAQACHSALHSAWFEAQHMEASCSSRIHVEAELELAFSRLYRRTAPALSDDPSLMDSPVAGCFQKRKSENATTDASHNIPRRRQLVNPTPMPDYMCPQVKPAPMPDVVCLEVSLDDLFRTFGTALAPGRPRQGHGRGTIEAGACCKNHCEPFLEDNSVCHLQQQVPRLLGNMTLLRRVEDVLQ